MWTGEEIQMAKTGYWDIVVVRTGTNFMLPKLILAEWYFWWSQLGEREQISLFSLSKTETYYWLLTFKEPFLVAHYSLHHLFFFDNIYTFTPVPEFYFIYRKSLTNGKCQVVKYNAEVNSFLWKNFSFFKY